MGERFVAQVVQALIQARTWKHTALFLTYDEHGGYYDHVPPPPAIAPDSVAPILEPGDVPASFDRYGFRVPTIVISPWAKPALRLARGPGPHLDHRLHRAQVEPARR